VDIVGVFLMYLRGFFEILPDPILGITIIYSDIVLEFETRFCRA
jgi:hypothetical protein